MAIYFTYGNVCSHVTFSIHPTLSSLPSLHVQKFVLYVCVSIAALHIILSVTSFLIAYICVSIWYLFFSFCLTSLCIIGFRFIHLIRTDSIAFLLWLIFLCIHVPHLLYPFICQWTFRLLSCLSYLNSTAMNIGSDVSIQTMVFFGFAESYGSSIF